VKCEAIRLRLVAYMDGELDTELQGQFAAHLRQCEECRKELEALGDVDALVTSLPRYGPSADFARILVSKVRYTVAPVRKGPILQRAWKTLLEYSGRFVELLEPETRVGTRSLDEFNDIPDSFIGYAYFKVLGPQR